MGAAWGLRSRQHIMEASPDLQPISLKFQEMRTNNKRGIKLPTDIINEIIEHLPAISNFRFKCVSKQWCSINFEALKLKSQTRTMSGVFYVTFRGVSAPTAKYVKTEKDQNDDFCIDGALSFLPKHCFIIIHDSCNGLLLCEGWDRLFLATDEFDLSSCLYVCNPATRKSVEIPKISTKRVAPFAFLDFIPQISVYFNVIIFMHDFQVSRNFKVFSSITGEWSVSQVSPLLSQDRCYVPELFYKGLIFAIDVGSTEIIGFDVKGKLCSRIDLPTQAYLNNNLFFSYLGQLGGCLHYYCYDSNSKVYVWKLESGSWLLKSRFSVPFRMQYREDIKFHPIKDDVVFLQINDKLYSYNIKTTQTVELCSHILGHKCCLYSPFYLDFSDNGW